MKVLDLVCQSGHVFEGWFASEQDFANQCQALLVQCPICSDASITKKLSAPRLNLCATPKQRSEESAPSLPKTIQAAAQWWEAVSQQLLANSEDVGEQFAQEARRIHYGESESRAIRGQTTIDEAQSLVDEGIEVLPLLVPPQVPKNSLH